MSADDDPPEFANAEAEARYWRTLVHDLRDELEEIRASSKDLETELDHDFEATERREAELKASIERLRGDLDDSKGRHQAALREHANTLSHMQRELESVRAAEQSLRTRVRDMEVDNDDLEKSERAMESTLQDLESRYSRAIERTALLEEELVAKARLEEEVQRVKDELRDANEELGVLRSQREAMPPPPERPLTPPGSGYELPSLASGAVADGPVSQTKTSTESETTPRKLADVRPNGMVRSSTAVLLANSRIPSPVSPQRRPSTSYASPSPAPLGASLSSVDRSLFAPKASTSTTRTPATATRRTGAAVSEFNAAKARILHARTERRTLPVSTSIPRVRRASLAPGATATPPVPTFASSTARTGFPRSSAARSSLANSRVTPTPPPYRRRTHDPDDSPDSSPTVAAAAISRRPPSRLSAVSTSSSSRPATPSGIPMMRSPTPSGSYGAMRPPSSLGGNRRKSLAPSTAAPPSRTAFGSSVAPSSSSHLGNGRPKSVGGPNALGVSSARRYSLKGSVSPGAMSTPPPPVPVWK